GDVGEAFLVDPTTSLKQQISGKIFRPERLASISLDAWITVGVHVWTLTLPQRPGVDAKVAFGQKMTDRSPKPLSTTRTWDDCALFVCKYMECLSQKSIIGFPFSQADMDIFRGKLAWAIIQEVNEQKAQEMTCE
ncbi:hypothetical protein Taro_051756, partial [Colocasia esculenta]|nr:hypothetical protein [Colocasia esculenta]